MFVPREIARFRNCDNTGTFGNIPEYGFKEG
jgi:hypothetical protein